MLGRLFEPYVVHLLPHLLLCFGDNNQYVREVCVAFVSPVYWRQHITLRSLYVCIASRSHRREWALLSFHSVCLSVGHSATYSLPRLIDHNQIWSAGIYLSSDPCKPFWISHLPYFGCQREKYAKFHLFTMRILATANVMHRAIWLVCMSVSVCLSLSMFLHLCVYDSVHCLCVSLSVCLIMSFCRVAQNKIPLQTICNIFANSGKILKILEAV